ncbi:MAG: Crp/Fnr family transcriptional regulator [Nitrospiraceae bacterium]|nr:Crp/Fnr family transcriptional regulator [Nitrospiraceae bacterium]
MKSYDMLYKKLILYSEIPPGEYEKLLKISRVCHLKKGEYFQRAGERPNKFGFVISGILRLYYTNGSGDEFNKSFCIETDLVAAYSALLQNRASRLSIQALEKTTLLVIGYKDYLKLLDQHMCWQILGRRIAENLFIKKEEKESQFLLDSVEMRYLKFLKEYPDLEVRIKQYHIASYLGITTVTLSRIRTKLRRKLT